MECILCRQKIKPGQHVFVGATVVFVGPENDDFDSIGVSDDLGGVVHLSCLKSPTEVVKTPNTVVPEPVVERSDALSLFGL